MKGIYLSTNEEIPLKRLEKELNSSTEITENVQQKNIKALMSEEIYDWKGELMVDENADLIYDFTSLRESQIEVQHLREKRQLDITIGQTVFDTARA